MLKYWGNQLSLHPCYNCVFLNWWSCWICARGDLTSRIYCMWLWHHLCSKYLNLFQTVRYFYLFFYNLFIQFNCQRLDRFGPVLCSFTGCSNIYPLLLGVYSTVHPLLYATISPRTLAIVPLVGNHCSRSVNQHAQYADHDTETEAAEWNSVVINVIRPIYTCAFILWHAKMSCCLSKVTWSLIINYNFSHL